MYHIDSKVDIPSSEYLYNEVKGMMRRGVKIEDLSKLYNTLQRDTEAYKIDIKTKYKILNPNSSAQVISFMNDLNDSTVVTVCCSRGKWTSKQQALQQLSDMGYEFAGDILGYRKTKKYADSIKAIMDAKDSEGRIHPQVSLTKTNRISYSDPPLMGIPKELIWDCIKASEPGNVLISADIKNQEPNILINMQGIESLKPALTNQNGLYETIFSTLPIKGRLNIIITNDEKPGIMNNSEMKMRSDIPAIYYTPKLAPVDSLKVKNEKVKLIEVINLVTPLGEIPELPTKIRVTTDQWNIYHLPIQFNVDWSTITNKKKLTGGGIIEVNGIVSGGYELECTTEVRKEFKRAWNAMTYGASALGIREMCNHIDGNELYEFFTSIPELQRYRKECSQLANSGTQKIKTYFGTVLTANEPNRSALKRILLDLPIQGTAADILSLLVKHFNEETKRMGIANDLKIIFTRHDELIIEATKKLIDGFSNGVDGVKQLVDKLVSHQIDNWEPFKVDVEVVSYREIKTSDLLDKDEE